MFQLDNPEDYIEIESVTLDEFFKDKGLRVNVMKMDIEGAELAAFAGMGEIIRHNDDLKIFAEFHLPALERSGISTEEFIRRFLEDYRFSILGIADYSRDKKYLPIKNSEDLMALCNHSQTVNLWCLRNLP